jgi:hypothetical protein
MLSKKQREAATASQVIQLTTLFSPCIGLSSLAAAFIRVRELQSMRRCGSTTSFTAWVGNLRQYHAPTITSARHQIPVEC